MADEHDAGIDKQKLLDEIVGASTVPESPAPPPLPLPPAPARGPVPPPPPFPGPEAPPAAPQPSSPPKPVPRLLEFRNEVAAMTLAICGVVWAAIGVATRSWFPGCTGILLLALAFGVWVREALRDE